MTSALYLSLISAETSADSTSHANVTGDGMDSEQILALYHWEPGACFHCARTGLDTTLVGVLHPQSSPAQQIRACRVCLLLLEADRQEDARRQGLPYVPGQVYPDDGEGGHSC